jgi:hypothetical protein
METETKTNHTPAPWTVSGKQIKAIDHGKRHTVATANNPKFTPEGNAANARLISAAPELLACLLDVLDADGDLDSMDFKRYRAAIERATG